MLWLLLLLRRLTVVIVSYMHTTHYSLFFLFLSLGVSVDLCNGRTRYIHKTDMYILYPDCKCEHEKQRNLRFEKPIHTFSCSNSWIILFDLVFVLIFVAPHSIKINFTLLYRHNRRKSDECVLVFLLLFIILVIVAVDVVVVIAAAAMQSFLQHAIFFFAWIKWISNNTADDVGNAMLLLYVNWGCRGWCLIFIFLSFVLFVCSECRCYDYMVMMTYKRFSFDCQLLLMSTNTTWIVKTSDNFKILQISYDRTKFNLFFFFLSIEYFCSRWQNYTWIYRFHVVKALC